MAILDQVPQKRETERQSPEPVLQPAISPVQKPTRKRRKKAEKEVLGEGEQTRFDGYLLEPETSQADTPELATERGVPAQKTENPPSEVRKISKPNV